MICINLNTLELTKGRNQGDVCCFDFKRGSVEMVDYDSPSMYELLERKKQLLKAWDKARKYYEV